MATYSQRFIDEGSEMVSVFICTTCKDKKFVKTAHMYCKTCGNFYCLKCKSLHNELFITHVQYGRNNMKNWPISKEVEDFIQMCAVHKSEILDKFCNRHSQLCCRQCVFHSHGKCTTIMVMSAKKQSVDIQYLSAKIKTISNKVKKLHTCCESSYQGLKESYQDQERMIREMSTNIKSNLEYIESSTLKEIPKFEQGIVKQMHITILSYVNEIEKKTLKETLQTTSTRQVSLKSHSDYCTRIPNELQRLLEALQYSSDKNMEKLCYIANSKCMAQIQQIESYLNEHFVKLERSVLNQTNRDTEQYLSKLSGLARLDEITKTVITYHSNIGLYFSKLSRLVRNVFQCKVFTIYEKAEYDVSLRRDSGLCWIRGICVLPEGKVLVSDYKNKRVKLLGKNYKAIRHWDAPAFPWRICQISPNEIAVTVGVYVQFITVNNSKLVQGRTIQFPDECYGIAHHQGYMFVTSGTALYEHAPRGKISKLYEDTSSKYTVYNCDVSPTGDKLYITNYSQHKLLTLARDGSVLAVLSDSEIICPDGVHVTPAGQVVVWGFESSTIIQVDSEGKRKLATLAKRRDGVRKPQSVCYNSNTESIVVGQYNSDTILVFKV